MTYPEEPESHAFTITISAIRSSQTPVKPRLRNFVIMGITGHTTFEMFKRYNKVDREDLMNGINSMGKKNNKAR